LTITGAIEGNIPAAVTPFNESGELLLDDFAEILQWHLSQDADGICIAGDNGEAWALTLEERKKLAKTAVKVISGRVPLIMGASAPTARQTIELAEIAAVSGVDAIMTGPQAYVLKASRREIVSRFEAIYKAVPLPLLLYNSPRRTGLNLDVTSFRAICNAVPVVGLKEASRDFFHVTHLIHHFGKSVPVLIGPCPFIIPGLTLGARGFISTGPELFGRKAADILTLINERPGKEIRGLHYRLTRIYETLMGSGTWPAAIKKALNLLGVPAGLPREPVEPLNPVDSEKLERVMRELQLLDEHHSGSQS